MDWTSKSGMSRSGTRDALSGFLGVSKAEVAPNVRRSRATLMLVLLLDRLSLLIYISF